MLRRFWVYQRERFPLAALGPLALVVGAGATMFSALARGAALPRWDSVLAAAASALLVFAQMRVLDEFKDFEDDARYRPYRPVPRGLVSFGELRGVLAAAGAGQVALALAIDARLVWLLFLLWGYLGLMSAEFFVRDWLRARAFAYLASHIPFGGLIALYASAFEWVPRSQPPHPALAAFGLAALFCTALLEIGRKIRAPRDEEPGVATYSALWGRPRAVGAWLAALLLVGACGLVAARATGNGVAFAVLLALVALAAALAAWRFLHGLQSRQAKAIEALSGATALALYAGLGPIPAVFG